MRIRLRRSSRPVEPGRSRVTVRRIWDLSRPVQRVIVAIVFLLVILVVGVVGYMLVEDMSFTDALYMVIITVSTVGFGEVQPLSIAGVYFTIAVVVLGVSGMLLFLTSVFEIILSEFLGDVWGRRRMQKSISKLENHYIICGFGRVGRSVAEELYAQGVDFIVVENDPEVFEECAEQGYLVIEGSAADDEVLEEAGIKEAQGLVSALKSDADNLYVTLTARVIRPDILLIARADQVDSMKKLEMVGADRVISPHYIAGKRMANLLTRPGACEFLDVVVDTNLPEYQLTELDVTGDLPISGHTIKGSRLREKTGVTILSIRKKGERAFNPNPSPEMLIEEGDTLILIGTPDQMTRMEEEEEIAGGVKKQVRRRG